MIGILLSTLLLAATATDPVNTLFGELVAATERGDDEAIARLLATRPLSTSAITLGADGRLTAGPMRHGVPVAEIAGKLRSCAVKQWQGEDTRFGTAYVLWECRSRRLPQNDCYYYSYRAALLDTRYHPANLFVHELPARDFVKCGGVIPPPPRP